MAIYVYEMRVLCMNGQLSGMNDESTIEQS